MQSRTPNRGPAQLKRQSGNPKNIDTTYYSDGLIPCSWLAIFSFQESEKAWPTCFLALTPIRLATRIDAQCPIDRRSAAVRVQERMWSQMFPPPTTIDITSHRASTHWFFYQQGALNFVIGSIRSNIFCFWINREHYILANSKLYVFLPCVSWQSMV